MSSTLSLRCSMCIMMYYETARMVFFFVKQETTYVILYVFVGSERSRRDRVSGGLGYHWWRRPCRLVVVRAIIGGTGHVG